MINAKTISQETLNPFQQEMIAFYKDPNSTPMGKKLMNQFNTIIHQVTHNPQLKIIWGQYQGGSFSDDVNARITIDPAMVPFCKDETEFKSRLYQILFVAAHEVGHQLITLYPEYIRELEKAGTLTRMLEISGLGVLCNAIEDCRDNSTVRREFPGFGAWNKKMYDEQLADPKAILFGDHALLQKIQQELGYTPNFAVFISEIIRYWHTGAFAANLPEPVEKLLHKTRDSFVAAYKLMPRTFDHYEVDRAARESFNIIWNDIWLGGFKDLMEDVLKLEEDRLMMSNPQTMQELWDSLTSEQQAKAIEMMLEAIQQQQQSSPNIPAGQAGAGGQEGGQSADAGQATSGEPAQSGAAQPQHPEAVPKDWKGQLDVNILPEDIKQKLEEAKAKLSTEDREKLKAQAEKNISEVEKQMSQAANKNSIGKGKPQKGQKADKSQKTEKGQDGEQSDSSQAGESGQPGKSSQGGSGEGFSMEPGEAKAISEKGSGSGVSSARTSAEELVDRTDIGLDETEAAEALDSEQLAKLQEESLDAKQKLEEISATNIFAGLNPYESVMVSYVGDIETMAAGIGLALQRNTMPSMRWGQYSGPYVDMNRAMQMEASPANYAVFGSKDIPEAIEDVFIFLLDISSSMDQRDNGIDARIELAFVGLVQVIEALERNGVRSVLIVFNNSPRMIKDENTTMGPQMRESISKVLDLTDGGTQDADAIEFGYEYALKNIPAANKWMIPITDGGTGQREKLKQVLSRIAKEGEMPLPIPLGFGPETRELKNNYPLSKGNLDPTSFAEFFPELIMDMISNRHAYCGGESMSGHFATPGMLDANFMSMNAYTQSVFSISAEAVTEDRHE